MTRWLLKILNWVFTPIIAILLIFEEWGWEPLSRLLKYLVDLPFWAYLWDRLGQSISRLPPWAALLVLAAPTALLFPVKLGALYLIGHGQHVAGITLLIVAKIVGTAILARLFSLTQPSMMQLAWFATWYPRWKAWKDKLLQRLRASVAWRAGRGFKASSVRGMRAVKGAFNRRTK